MKPSLNRGFSTVKEAQQKIEVRREQAKNNLRNFFPPKDGSEVEIYFLTEDPICYLCHQVSVPGSNRFDTVFCKSSQGEDCPECDRNDSPREQWSWLVWDTTPFEVKERDSNGKETGRTKTVNGSVKKMDRGVTDAALLNKNQEKYGLAKRPWAVSKNPSGKGWVFDRGDEGYLSKTDLENIRKTLPEKIRDLDFYEILERQIIPPTVGGGVSREEARKVASQGMEDMEEDESQEEVEEKQPRKVLMRKK